MADDKKKGRPPKAGNRKHKFAKFFATTQAKKLRHVARRNGSQAAAILKDYYWELQFGRTTKKQIEFPAPVRVPVEA